MLDHEHILRIENVFSSLMLEILGELKRRGGGSKRGLKGVARTSTPYLGNSSSCYSQHPI